MRTREVCPYCLGRENSECCKCGNTGQVEYGDLEEEFEPLPEDDEDFQE
jgi:hypothetical protein